MLHELSIVSGIVLRDSFKDKVYSIVRGGVCNGEKENCRFVPFVSGFFNMKWGGYSSRNIKIYLSNWA